MKQRLRKTAQYFLSSIILLISILSVFGCVSTSSLTTAVDNQVIAPRNVEYVIDYRLPETRAITLSSQLSPNEVQQVAEQVANWQLAQFDIRSNKMRPEKRPSGIPNGWMYATLHIGLWRWAVEIDDPAYKQTVLNLSLLNGFKLGPRVYHADDHAVGDVYLSLYNAYGGEEKLRPTMDYLTQVVESPDTRSFDFEIKQRDVHEFEHRTFKDPWCTRRWCWADAAFMSPPVFAHLSQITSDPRFVDFMHREFWEMTDYLFDTDYGLFLRDSRYFKRKDDQGRPIFWGRGNGWVLAGIARILEFVDNNDPNYQRYADLFVQMSNTLLRYQNTDGSWPSSLLEAGDDAHSETSATGLLAFALAWGVNNELLPSTKFRPAIERAWDSIVTNIEPNGKVGFVQQVAFAPGSAKQADTQLYGSGAVLLAAAEIHQMLR